MTRTIFIIWLSAGVLLGWLVGQLVQNDERKARKLIPVKISSPEAS